LTIEIPHPRNYIIERCPYCGRRLAEWFEGDGHVTFLHDRAGITYYYADLQNESQGRPLEGSAVCLRVLCRIRRRLNSRKTPEVSA
jgi:hypothetical protein